ncbi:MAG: molybdenum cofactor guanylyltransferase [Candidatus Anammoxibacter sp.]
MTAIILVGGKSRRMGTNKAFLDFKGETFLKRQINLLSNIFDEIIISANSLSEYKKFNLPVIKDIYPERGPLGGIYTGLMNSSSFYTFVLACDMPFVESKLIKQLETYTKMKSEKYDVIVPENGKQLEPLHAFYSQNCIEPIKNQIEDNNLKIINFFSKVKVKKVAIPNVAGLDNTRNSLSNLNTPEEYKKEI